MEIVTNKDEQLYLPISILMCLSHTVPNSAFRSAYLSSKLLLFVPAKLIEDNQIQQAQNLVF